ncbi:high-affinity lysophosphatidic acid receptor [Stegostoma tigrinum]|uniref:high-affinity lysophosphatidic acid receptor n=1 Tax=Stegostoma tigrinum TaxID=3053191 RepID=UPI00202B1AC5|nr:high-affinity lysophosphatidic acid receptor [Stegostoma tigrinum]XP_048389079.1 high-affinity lysophosphatidic acid receptor [Stegostoma tigrinum]XP_048389080.1 high-affinity lysophosphatidic acid receptor [Stegostoma tigrinum]XP_048389081.1 high-affinity lysophosphatidic acid receptor [Stegostoma tigrinum]
MMACNSTLLQSFTSEVSNETSPTVISGKPNLPIIIRILLAIVMMSMIAVGFLGNAVVCLIVCQKPAMRSAINLLLATLAFSDIMLSLMCMPFTMVTIITVEWIFGSYFCRIAAMLYWFFVLEGVAILLIISVDRYLIIVQRQDKLNPHRAKIMIVISWAVSFCVAFPSVIGWTMVEVPTRAPQCVLGYTATKADRVYAVILLVTIFFIPFSVMLYSYLCILNTVRRNSVRIHNHAESLCLSQVSKLGLMGLQRPNQMNIDMSFKTRAFTTILILFVGFSFCWLPYTVYSLLSVFSESFYHSHSFYNVSIWVLWLTYLKSVFNPIIYCWRIKKFRQSCKEFMPKTFKVLPKLPGRSRRRIRPSTVYVCSEHQSTV